MTHLETSATKSKQETCEKPVIRLERAELVTVLFDQI